MNANLIGNDSDRKAWLALRRTGIGASEVSAVLGLSPFTSALEVFAEKTDPSPPDDSGGTEIMDWGRIFEAPILREFGKRTGRVVRSGGELYRSEESPFMLATVDGWQGSDSPQGPDDEWENLGHVEVKMTSLGKRYREELPVEVACQIQAQFAVLGTEMASCVWLPVPERKLGWVDVQPHAEFIAYIREKLAAFWARVESGVPPAPDGSESADRALARLYPEDSGERVSLAGPDWTGRADRMKALQRERIALEKAEKELQQLFKASLETATWGDLDDGRRFSLKTISVKPATCEACGHEKLRASYRKPYLHAAPKGRAR